MTSPSRKNRRTTASATTRAAWTSLAAFGIALPVLAQSQPAPTSWKPYQPPTVQASPVAAPVAVPDVPVMPSPVPVPKIMPMTKPAGETRPTPLPTLQPAEAAPLQAQKLNLPPLPEMPTQPPPRPMPTRPVPQMVPQMVATPVAMPQQQPVPVRTAVRQAPPEPLPTPIQTAPVKPVTPAVKAPPATTPLAAPKAAVDLIPGMRETTGGLPNQEDLFRFQSDTELNARILRETKKMDEKFPNLPGMVPAGTVYVPKTATYEPMQVIVEPNYVIHRRLYFEEMNSERAGWDAGPAQSVFSTFYFYRDVLLWPSRLTSHMRCAYDASPGKCRPGDPTPYYYYPHGVTWFGAAVGCAFYGGMGFVVW